MSGMNWSKTSFAPGARILARDAEWLIRRVDNTSTGGQALKVVGISELVRDKEAIFLTEIDDKIEVLDPAKTNLVQDESSGYRSSLLYLESLLRQTPPTDERIYTGHRAAMDAVPYQLDPAIQALQQPRQRILIADSVGLGKTLEAGILVSELIRRGRGKRILVAAVKSMLTQFQKEFWSRFTIPLTRLDSIGLQRIRSRIPTNHNPFHYFDKSIVSIDTLKQDAEYRTYLENAWWDIIIIDEAHNVAERGKGASLRSRLAKLLSTRSDTLIMLSATPHDGSAESFASLMNMLDPTAIANPGEYTKDEIQGLFIRRFKKDIQSQVASAFKERKIATAPCDASPVEEAAFDTLTATRFAKLDRGKGAGELFKTTLEKSLFSSPMACMQTIGNRIRQLEKQENPDLQEDIGVLKVLAEEVRQITPEHFTKYQRLVQAIRRDFGWDGKNTADRLVLFTERIETLKFLAEHLPRDLKLKDKQVEILHGSMSDVEQQQVVEAFGKDEEPVRLLIASDVASEGINLHYLCHRMIHFDIPWSLMVFQQRNGRIDRYGQEQTPHIVYLTTNSQNDKIRGDMRILELLIQKDEQATKNIGDPAAFMGVYDINEEERLTAEAMEASKTPEQFEAERQSKPEEQWDVLSMIMGNTPPPAGEMATDNKARMPALFADDYAYLEAALSHLGENRDLQVRMDAQAKMVEFTAPKELKQRFRFLPREIWPENGQFSLSQDRDVIQQEIKRSRKDENAWPTIHYLWEQNPMMQWVNDQVLAAFKRHEAPVIWLNQGLGGDETVFLMSGLIPNRKGHPLVHRWFGVGFQGKDFSEIEELDTLLGRTGLGKRLIPNPMVYMDDFLLKQLLPKAVERARGWMSGQRNDFEDHINPKLNDQLKRLEGLRGRQFQQLELRFDDLKQAASIVESRKEQEKRRIDTLFDTYLEWVEDTMTTEEHAYIQVAAVLVGRQR
ncbi:helicase domain protein [Magnetococcus marinus MC-1]|uniref:Helicase domain protein n=1 Tax=Magnetococcus marinus (strain ATCC BAA-1437 / JCM 17883 / MC-1) TaxID=156889 RepID=A0L7C3_MAGMM|nr:helicase-related protein [Magnetococcus marinus]ABK43866.1 helicase domain protein [Magnetococcus marinus MC-1]